MLLYIANPTNQNRQITYRLDFSVDDHGNRTSNSLMPYKHQDVPAGQQRPIGGDLHITQVEEIVRQLAEYGLVAMTEMKTAKARGKVAMLFNLDRPVPGAVMRDAQDHNMGILEGEGERRRQAAAIASSNALANQVAGQGFPDVKEPGKFEMEFEQVTQDENYARTNLAEGLRVVRDHGQPKPPAKARARRSRAA